jgi:hypothetical protein
MSSIPSGIGIVEYVEVEYDLSRFEDFCCAEVLPDGFAVVEALRYHRGLRGATTEG